jgi:hypothetical protein
MPYRKQNGGEKKAANDLFTYHFTLLWQQIEALKALGNSAHIVLVRLAI